MRNEKCPKCEVRWQEEETIYEHFLNKGYTKEKAAETAEMYGCTKENPKHFGKNVTGVEIQGGYDGVSYWQCSKCETYFDRWTMEEVG